MHAWGFSPSRFTGCLFGTGHGSLCLWLRVLFLSVHRSSHHYYVCSGNKETVRENRIIPPVDRNVDGRKSSP